MLEIKGKYNTAVCYAEAVEEGAVEQIRRMCDQAFTEGARIRIMPDVHAGKGCTIGTTMTVHDKVVPNVVGVDIGCGMYTVELAERVSDLPALDAAAHAIPSGREVWDGRRERFDLTELACYRSLKDAKRLARSLGTLGGGNHFIEVDVSSEGVHYLVIHSGSRNLGKQVAEHYQALAVELLSGKADFYDRREEIIRTYKEEGRRSEIQGALKALGREYEKTEPPVPPELCYLSGRFLDAYLHDVEICQRFAKRNRELMAEIISDMCGLHAVRAFHTVHNYIDGEARILRKGAISAKQGELVLIPINMRDGSVLAVGRGDPEWNFSAPHGAGRVLSRHAAREQLDMEAYRLAMAGIYTTSVSEETLDEAPMAYKSLGDILGPIAGTVDVIEVLKPIYNFKAGE